MAAIGQRAFLTLWRQPVLVVSTMIFPIVYLVHAPGEAPSVDVHSPVLFAFALIFACFLAAAMGLFIGTVLDPRKVTRTALQNAASIASLVLTTQCMIAQEQEPAKAAEAPE